MSGRSNDPRWEDPDSGATQSESARAARDARAMPDVPRDLIEGYQIVAGIGRGAMGAVFRGRQISLDRTVAIKILDPDLAADDSFVRRFHREARAVARLNHPNVVTAIDVGRAGAWHYLVMEYVQGRPLDVYLRSKGPLDEAFALRIVWQIGAALRHARRHGVVHRDVKPANILITRNGDAKLCDLGLAKRTGSDATYLTAVGTTMGTPHYVSPEQIRGEPDVDIRTDIYSLGATAYEIVCGCPPFDGPNVAVVLAKHLTEEFTPVRLRRPDVSEGCARVIEKMLEKDREKRYQRPKEFMIDVKAVAEGTWRPPAPTVPEEPATAPIDLSELKRAQEQLRSTRRRRGGRPRRR